MTTPLTSVTMSAYNVEPFLRDCLDCIVNQTLKDIEIICVNDGSTDGTLSILQDFAGRDPRIKVIDKLRNEGLAVARNDAIRAATGKYIAFVDGDDLLDRDLFRKAYEHAEQSQSDMVMWDYVSFSNEVEIAGKSAVPSALLAVDPADRFALLDRPAFAWTKLIRTEKARELRIEFPAGLTYQDIPVHWKLVTQLERIALLPERLSYYRQQPAATTHRTGWKRTDMAAVMEMVRHYLHDAGLYQRYGDLFLRKQLESLCGVHDVIDPPLKDKMVQLIQERLTEEHWQYVLDGKPLRRQARDFYMALHGSKIAKMRRVVWLSARWCYRGLKRNAE